MTLYVGGPVLVGGSGVGDVLEVGAVVWSSKQEQSQSGWALNPVLYSPISHNPDLARACATHRAQRHRRRQDLKTYPRPLQKSVSSIELAVAGERTADRAT